MVLLKSPPCLVLFKFDRKSDNIKMDFLIILTGSVEIKGKLLFPLGAPQVG